MPTITEFSLENAPYFNDKATFKFTKGITFVHGRNLQRSGKSASNGSGKTLLFSVLPNLLFNTSPVITKNAKQAAARLYEKNTTASVRLKHNNKRIEFVRQGSKTNLLINGEDTSSRVARGELSELLDITETDFFSWVYLDSRRPNNFQLGTSADRLTYLTNLYRLGNLDTLRKHVAKELGSIQSDRQVLDEVQSNLKEDKACVVEVPEDIDDKCDKTAHWIKQAQKAVSKLAAAEARQEAYKTYRAEAKQLAGMEKGDPDAEAELEQVQAELDEVLEELQKARGLQDTREQLAKLKSVDLSRLAEVEEANDELKKLGKVQTVKKPVCPSFDKPETLCDVEEANRKLDRVKDKLADVEKKKARFINTVGHDSNCPVCLSHITDETHKDIVTMFDKAIAGARKAIDRCTALVEWAEYKESVQEYKAVADKQSKMQQLRAVVDGYDLDAAYEKKRLLAVLKKLKTESPNLEVLTKKRDTLRVKRLELVAQARKHNEWLEQKRLVDRLKQEAPEQYDAAKKEKLEGLLGKAIEKLPEMEANRALRKDALRRIKQNREKAKQLQEKVSDEESYRALMQAYSNKGVKTLLVRKIAEKLESNLNRYAKHVFSEAFEFKLEVTDTQFHVWAIRRAGIKAKVVSDVRHLSGAESRLFNFLFVLALLPTIPAKRRFSTLIMDEPETGMDAETLEAFTKKLLPALAEIVPSVVVITPKNDYVTEGARIVTVVKAKGKSTLIEGAYNG